MSYEYEIERRVSKWTGTPSYYVHLSLDGRRVFSSEPFMTHFFAKRSIRKLAKNYSRNLKRVVGKGQVVV